LLSLFFDAANAYSRSFYELFCAAKVNSFLSLNWMKKTLFSNCFQQLSLAWQFATIGSSTSISLNTSNQDRGEKMIRMTPDCAF